MIMGEENRKLCLETPCVHHTTTNHYLGALHLSQTCIHTHTQLIHFLYLLYGYSILMLFSTGGDGGGGGGGSDDGGDNDDGDVDEGK